MSSSSVLTSMPELESEPAAPRMPMRELLPTGSRRAAVVSIGLVLIVASFVEFGASGRALVGAVLCPALVALAAIDIKHRLLPNVIVFPSVLAVALIIAAAEPGAFLTHLAAGAALGGFFFAFGAIFSGSLGMGDAKLGFLLGLALGSRTLPAVMVALVGLFVAALWVLATRGMAARKQALPFGPFLALGGILAFFFG
jgi:leader peptidase (prepilin peptidase) / N-methyltransferase